MAQQGTESAILKKSYLKKLKTMKKKYFVLLGDTLTGPARLEYYSSEKKFLDKKSQPRRSVALRSCLGISAMASSRHELAIALHTRDDCLAVGFDVEAERDDWLAAMHALVGGHRGDAHTPMFEHVWNVNVRPKSLGRGLAGAYRLCLTERTLSLVKKASAEPAIAFPLEVMRRCGHSDNFFFIEVGRQASTGEGELWMEAEDALIAQNAHYAVLRAMNANKDVADGTSQAPLASGSTASSVNGASRRSGSSAAEIRHGGNGQEATRPRGTGTHGERLALENEPQLPAMTRLSVGERPAGLSVTTAAATPTTNRILSSQSKLAVSQGAVNAAFSSSSMDRVGDEVKRERSAISSSSMCDRRLATMDSCHPFSSSTVGVMPFEHSSRISPRMAFAAVHNNLSSGSRAVHSAEETASFCDDVSQDDLYMKMAAKGVAGSSCSSFSDTASYMDMVPGVIQTEGTSRKANILPQTSESSVDADYLAMQPTDVCTPTSAKLRPNSTRSYFSDSSESSSQPKSTAVATRTRKESVGDSATCADAYVAMQPGEQCASVSENLRPNPARSYFGDSLERVPLPNAKAARMDESSLKVGDGVESLPAGRKSSSNSLVFASARVGAAMLPDLFSMAPSISVTSSEESAYVDRSCDDGASTLSRSSPSCYSVGDGETRSNASLTVPHWGEESGSAGRQRTSSDTFTCRPRATSFTRSPSRPRASSHGSVNVGQLAGRALTDGASRISSGELSSNDRLKLILPEYVDMDFSSAVVGCSGRASTLSLGVGLPLQLLADAVEGCNRKSPCSTILSASGEYVQLDFERSNSRVDDGHYDSGKDSRKEMPKCAVSEPFPELRGLSVSKGSDVEPVDECVPNSIQHGRSISEIGLTSNAISSSTRYCISQASNQCPINGGKIVRAVGITSVRERRTISSDDIASSKSPSRDSYSNPRFRPVTRDASMLAFSDSDPYVDMDVSSSALCLFDNLPCTDKMASTNVEERGTRTDSECRGSDDSYSVMGFSDSPSCLQSARRGVAVASESTEPSPTATAHHKGINRISIAQGPVVTSSAEKPRDLSKVDSPDDLSYTYSMGKAAAVPLRATCYIKDDDGDKTCADHLDDLFKLSADVPHRVDRPRPASEAFITARHKADIASALEANSHRSSCSESIFMTINYASLDLDSMPASRRMVASPDSSIVTGSFSGEGRVQYSRIDFGRLEAMKMGKS